MRDVIGLAAAVVIALLSQIVEPWSRTWWGGMIASGSIFLVAAGHLSWRAWRNLARLKLIPLLLAAMALAGAILIAAAIAGLVAYRSGAVSGQVTTAAAPAPQATPKTKNYFPGEKEDLGRVLSNISEALNGEGLTSANDAFRLTASWNPPQKPQLQEMLDRLEAIRKMTRVFLDRLRYEIVAKNPRFKSELHEILGDQDNKPMRLQSTMETFHRELSILSDRYDRLTPDDRGWTGQLIFKSEGAAVYRAAIEMQGWIGECNQHIDQMRELLR